VYFELRKLAAHWIHKQPAHHTLQATALVHEAYLKLWGGRSPVWADREHLLAAASQAMRHVLVDHARARRAQKRPSDRQRTPLDELVLSYEAQTLDLVALDDALAQMEAFDPQMARAVDLRVFGGLDPAETARLLGISRRTFDRRWSAIRVWLRSRME
jgi:RNA polymerase sigma factor (TIGR02999 family)